MYKETIINKKVLCIVTNSYILCSDFLLFIFMYWKKHISKIHAEVYHTILPPNQATVQLVKTTESE